MPIAQARRSGSFRDLVAALGAPPAVAPAAVTEDRVLATAAGAVPVRLYHPYAPVRSPPPPLVWMHGGGFVFGDLDDADATARMLCAGLGALVASVDYPLAPEHPFPAAPDACRAALDALVGQADGLGFDPGRIGVGGDSAGGNLATVTALGAAADGGPALRVQLLVYPMVDMTGEQPSMRENGEGYLLSAGRVAWFTRQYLGEHNRRDPLASPLHASTLEGLPPAVVVTADLDPLRDEAEAYATRLRDAGVTVELTRHDGLIHGFLALTGASPRSRAALDAAIAATRARL